MTPDQTRQSEIEKLIEKIEKAAGPSRFLDALIAIHVCPDLYAPDDYDLDKGYVVYLRGGKPIKKDLAPAFTESLDTAMTLVPDDCEWHVGSVKLLGTFWAELVSAAEKYIGKGAKTPALALCSAALKSTRAEQG